MSTVRDFALRVAFSPRLKTLRWDKLRFVTHATAVATSVVRRYVTEWPACMCWAPDKEICS
jgi:hypothetical protein